MALLFRVALLLGGLPYLMSACLQTLSHDNASTVCSLQGQGANSLFYLCFKVVHVMIRASVHNTKFSVLLQQLYN